jgi:hypothetical protein
MKQGCPNGSPCGLIEKAEDMHPIPVLGHEVSYLPRLAASLVRVPDVYVVLLTSSPTELARRFSIEPDLWFNIDQITAANERIPSIADLLPDTVPHLHADTTSRSVSDVYEEVRQFLRL